MPTNKKTTDMSRHGVVIVRTTGLQPQRGLGTECDARWKPAVPANCQKGQMEKAALHYGNFTTAKSILPLRHVSLATERR